MRRKPSRHITAESEAFTFLYRARCYLGFFVMAQVSMLVWFSRSSPQSHPELHLTDPQSSGPPVPLTSPPSPPSPALERRADEAQRLAFWRVLERLQNPSDCRRASMYIFLPTPYQSGFGSQLRICELARACHGSAAMRRQASTPIHTDAHLVDSSASSSAPPTALLPTCSATFRPPRPSRIRARPCSSLRGWTSCRASP